MIDDCCSCAWFLNTFFTHLWKIINYFKKVRSVIASVRAVIGGKTELEKIKNISNTVITVQQFTNIGHDQ